jgi:glutamyl-tRNA reductase
MAFITFGLNHRTAPLALRERFALSENAVRRLYQDVRPAGHAEFIVLSTCNRTEAYVFGEDDDRCALEHMLVDYVGLPWPRESAYVLRDEAAVRHILHVAAGLDSMVVGDAQILAQLKDAYRWAVDEASVGTVLHRLMHTAFRTAKRIVTETDLASGRASVPGMAARLAVAFAREQGWKPVEVLILGAGQMARLAAEAIRGEMPARIRVANRTAARARVLAEAGGYESVDWEARHAAAAEAHLVVAATGAPEPVLTAPALAAASPSDRPRLVLDLGTPRNVSPEVAALPGFRLIDLDGLNERIAGIQAERLRELPAAHRIVDEMVADFVAWFFHHQALQPAIHTILETFDTIRRQEIDRHAHRLTAFDRAELDRLTWSIMQKVLAVPVVRLKTAGLPSIDYAQGIHLLQTLFAREGCDEVATSPHDERPVFAVSGSGCPFDERPASIVTPAMRIVPERPRILRLGTRGSALALWQARYVKDRLEAAGHAVLIEEIATEGDRRQDVPLTEVEGKAFFTKDIDQALLDGRIDLAVHSLKDLPTELPEGLVLAAVPTRESPFDAFVAHPSYGGGFDELPAGARIATSSLRRTALLRARRPDLEIVLVRGNVDTRLRKLAESPWAGMVLASAGLIRLGLADHIRTELDPAWMLPAVGQGALAVVSTDRTGLSHELAAILTDAATEAAVRAERAFLRRLEGGCQVPVGAWARLDTEGRLILDGAVAALDGRVVVRGRRIVGAEEAESGGEALADQLLAEGADRILALIRS